MKESLKNKDIYYRSKIVGFATVLLFFVFFFYSSSQPVLTFIDNNIGVHISFIRDYLLLSRIIVSLGITVLFIGKFYDKNDFNLWGLKWLVILILSFLFSRFLLMRFLDSEYWWASLTVGLFVGVLVYVFTKSDIDNKNAILSGFTSFLAVLYMNYHLYFLSLDPPFYPSVFYANSFPNMLYWIGVLLFLFFSAFYLSKGFLIKKVLK